MNNSEPRNGISVGPALRQLRSGLGLTQSAAAEQAGTPGFRAVSHWETGRKTPSLTLVYQYLKGLGLDFHDLQDALDRQEGGRATGGYEALAARLEEVEQRLATLEEEDDG